MSPSRFAALMAVVAAASVVAAPAEATHRRGHHPRPTPTPTPTPTAIPTPTPAGCGFTVSPSPSASGLDNVLHDISARSASDAWAVGHAQVDGGGRFETLIMHWNGSAWQTVPSPNRLLGDNNAINTLQGVTAIAPDDVWAVGYTVSYDDPYRTLAMHWDGVRWRIVDTPNPGSSYSALNDVTAVGPNDVWAVGGAPIQDTSFNPIDPRTRGFTLHWDGRAWSEVPGAPGRDTNSTLAAATAVSSSEVWAIGQFNPWRWDGLQWSSSPLGTQGGHGLDAAGPADVWTVSFASDYGDYGYNPRPYAYRWNGSAWEYVSARALDVGRFLDVAVRAPRDVIAVGNSLGSAFAARWNGSAWEALPAANGNPRSSFPLANDNILVGVDSAPDGSTWAVGYFWDSTGTARSLIERLNC